MNTQLLLSISTVAAILAISGPARADGEPSETEGGADAKAGVSLGGGSASAGAGMKAKPKGEGKWIRRFRPREHDLFVGVFGGALFPSGEIELGDVDKVTESYDSVAPEFGVRMGYYPLRHFGMEGEVAAIPAQYQGDSAFVYTARAHGVLQLGFWRVTPFALLGGGALAVASDDSVVGNESDSALHVGGGVKMLLNERMQLRLDVRDVISPRTSDSQVPVHSPEALLTFAVRFGVAPKSAPAAPPPPDRDGDGVSDAEDHCPFDAGEDGQGCPFADGDCDGITDNVDACPAEAGGEANGCPSPDSDGDGVLDEADSCPNEAGDQPDGCPVRDADGDGILDGDDKCKAEPETKNGFEDHDGCPDELPAEVKAFSGVIQGIFFDTGKATIKSTSEAVLDNAAAVLLRYPDLRVEVVGHTDNKGNHDKNVELSRKRADAVRDYMVSKGVDAAHLEPRGAGPDEPMADNATKAGRAKNRRIEFKLLPM